MGELVVHFEGGKIESFECESKKERIDLLVSFVKEGRRWYFWRRTAQDGSTVEESV